MVIQIEICCFNYRVIMYKLYKLHTTRKIFNRLTDYIILAIKVNEKASCCAFPKVIKMKPFYEMNSFRLQTFYGFVFTSHMLSGFHASHHHIESLVFYRGVFGVVLTCNNLIHKRERKRTLNPIEFYGHVI